MDFIGIAADQLINNAAKLRFMTAGRTTAPITVRTQVYGGLATGATHSQTLEAWFMHIPGMKVIVPSTPRDAKGLLRRRSSMRIPACSSRRSDSRARRAWCQPIRGSRFPGQADSSGRARTSR